MEVFRLFGSVFLKDKEAQQGLDNVDQKAKGVGGRMTGMLGTAAKWGAGIAAAGTAAGVALFALTNRVTANAEAIAVNASKAGMGAEAYQKMHFWAKENNVSQSAMDRAMGRLNQRMGRAANGNDKYAEALENVGVNVDDVKNGTVSTEEAMKQSIKTLSEMDNEQKQSAYASELFGTKLARDLMPALREGNLTFEEAAEKAEKLGLILSEDQIKASEEFQTSWSRVKQSLGAVTAQIGLAVLPIFQTLLDWVLSYLPMVSDTFSAVSGWIGNAANYVVEWIQSLIAWISDWAADNSRMLSDIWSAYQLYLSLIVAYWTQVFQTARDVIVTVLNFLSSFISGVLSRIRGYWQENGEDILSRAIDIFTSVREAVSSALSRVAALVHLALQRIRNYWEENGEDILQTAKATFLAVRDAISEVISFLVDLVSDGIQNIRDLWESHGENIVTTVLDIFTRIREAVSTAIEFITDLFGNMGPVADSFIDSFATIRDSLQPALASLRNLFSSVWDVIQTLKPVLIGLAAIVGGVIVSAIGVAVSVINGLIAALGPLIEAVVHTADILLNMFGLIVAFLTGDMAGAMDYWFAISDSTIAAVKALFTGIVNFFSTFISTIIDFFRGLYTTLVGNSIIPDMVNAIVDWFRNMFGWLSDIVSSIISAVVSGFNSVLSAITGALSSARNAVQSGLNFIRNIFTTVTAAVRSVTTAAFNAARNIIQSTISTIRNVISSGMNFARNTVTNATNSIRNTFTNIFNSLHNIVTSAFSNVRSAVSNGMSNAFRVVTSFLSRFRDAGRNIVTNIANGITSAIGSVTSAIGNVTSKIRDFLPFSPAKEGDLKDIDKLDFDGPIADSIDRGKPNIEHSMEDALALPDGGAAGQTVSRAESAIINLAEMFKGAIFNVRSDEDIEKIVRKIYKKLAREW